eukprot:8531787-Lingulodinium_polyedra.AAC.1
MALGDTVSSQRSGTRSRSAAGGPPFGRPADVPGHVASARGHGQRDAKSLGLRPPRSGTSRGQPRASWCAQRTDR